MKVCLVRKVTCFVCYVVCDLFRFLPVLRFLLGKKVCLVSKVTKVTCFDCSIVL